ncbi:diguanylate cyclase domain-containing protein [Colwellia sp. TT2012]|uniref:diguanylate cyclase domain-containing protein n=1 Tax=Colwellia sp. TT2012 TaxID=1720342 RepID=UPI000709B6BC|nr:diguanylate cyclase [Colwellia sp. TT2012]
MKKKLALLEVERKHLKIVSDFAVKILSIDTFEQVLWYLARNVVAKLGFDDVVIYMLDDNRQVFVQKAAFGNKNPSGDEILQPIEIVIGKGVVGHVALSKQSLLINDTRDFPGYIIDDEMRLSELAVPMMLKGEVIGIIDSEHKSLGFYTHQHQRTLTALASITATKINETKLLSQLKNTIKQLEYSGKMQDALINITEITFDTICLEQFFQRLHTCIAELVFSENFYIALSTKNANIISIPYYTDKKDKIPKDLIIPLNQVKKSITFYVLDIEKPLLVNEPEIDNMISEGKFHLIGSMPKTWLGVPFGKGNSKGIIVVQSYDEENMFNEKDKKLLMFAAKHIRNAIERIQEKAELSFLALHDKLTKLPNRALFSDRMEHAIANLNRKTSKGIAVFFLDLDKFKKVNDTYGHHIGDQLLIEMTCRVKSCLRTSDTLCRLGGDEFAILLENISDFNDVTNIANNIINIMQKPIIIDQMDICISISIGVVCSKGGVLAEKLLIYADEAMYQAKNNGRNQVYFSSHH